MAELSTFTTPPAPPPPPPPPTETSKPRPRPPSSRDSPTPPALPPPPPIDCAFTASELEPSVRTTAAVAAAAANRLRQNAQRLLAHRLQRRAVGDRDGAAAARGAAEAARGDDAAAHAAVAAAAADRLRFDGVGVLACRRDIGVGGVADRDVAAGPARRAEPADADRAGHAGRGVAAAAAAAADRLREQAVRGVARRRDHAGVRDGHILAVPGRPAEAADGDLGESEGLLARADKHARD